ncbi:MAG: TonB-dependent receptor [Flavobacteriales bacterium]|nr:TonB-dependent receptor [Flavobacteriales bacterium]
MTILILCWSFSNGQQLDLDRRLSLDLDTTLEGFLDILDEHHDVNFSYNPDKIDLNTRVRYKTKKTSLRKIMKEVSQKANFQWEVMEKQIIIQDVATQKKPLEPIEKPKNFFVIQGHIKDKSSHETMIGATVYHKGLSVGTITNEYGFFSLRLPEGQHRLHISFIGYNESIIEISLNENKTLNHDLEFNEALLDEVEITDEELMDYQILDPMKAVKIRSVEVDRIPKYLGESEPIKALTSYPGLQSHGDGSVYFYVRGGQRDQNLILLDEAPIYVPAHLLGFFSSITTDAIKDLEVYKSDVPAEKGGAISSIIDIQAKNGNLNHFSTNGSISPFATRWALEGPFKKEVASYYLSMRSSHVKWLIPRNQRSSTELGFGDVYAKVNWKLGDHHRLYWTFYAGNDELSRIGTGLGNFGLNWNNSTITLRWNHIFSQRFFANYTFYGSQYNYNLITSSENNQFWNERITNSSFKADYSFFKDPNNTIRYGFQFKGHLFNPGNLNFTDSSDFITPIVPERAAGHRIFYFSQEKKWSNKWAFRYGIRYNAWVNRGPTIIYRFNEGQVIRADTFHTNRVFHKFRNLEPRLSLSRRLDSSSTIKLSYNHKVQYLQLLTNTTSPFTSLAVWMPSGPNIKPQKSHDLVLGYYKSFKGKWNITSEVFYRRLENQIDYVDHPNLLLNPLIEGELRQGHTNAYGIECNVEKNFGQNSGRLGYSYNRAIMQINDLNNGNPYSAFQDRPHQISFLLNHKISEKWTVSLMWNYLTGAAYTTPVGFYSYLGQQVPYYGDKNNDRLPAYHRLDVSSVWKLGRKKDAKWKHDLTLTIYNAYGRRNPSFLNFNKFQSDNGFSIPLDLIESYRFTPTTISFLGFIPSLTYNFKFR